MKFTISKDLNSNPTLKLLVRFYTLFLTLYLIGSALFKVEYFGSSIPAVFSTLLGNEEEFTEALSLVSLLEMVHVDLFLGLLALFTLVAIFARFPYPEKLKQRLIMLSMGSLLLSSMSLFLGAFFASFFIYVFIFSTIAYYSSAIIIAFLIFIKLK